jgi:hypothetical protein
VNLVWLGLILAVIVSGGVVAVWTVRLHTLRSGRLIDLHQLRLRADIEGLGDDQRSRDAWAAFLAQAAKRQADLEDVLSAKDAMDRLVDLLNERRLEVVA